MIYPKPLQPGDAIAIVSPASKIDTKLVDSACATLARWGFDPIVGRHCKGSCGSYSGTIDQRLSDLREAAENPKVRAVLCSRGGYGVVHLLSSLSPEFWKTAPYNPYLFLLHIRYILLFHNLCRHGGGIFHRNPCGIDTEIVQKPVSPCFSGVEFIIS